MYKFYTTNCPKCMLIKKLLDDKKLDYELIDLRTNKEEMTRMTSMGFSSAPLLGVDGEILDFKAAFKELQSK